MLDYCVVSLVQLQNSGFKNGEKSLAVYRKKIKTHQMIISAIELKKRRINFQFIK